MIYIIHHKNTLVKILNENREEIVYPTSEGLVASFFSIAKTNPEQLIIWCNEAYVDALNLNEVKYIFQNPKMMVSYSVANRSYLPDQIGYVEDSPFIKVKYDVSYPTWFMSSDVGGIHTQVLNALNPKDFKEKNLDLFLNSVAKILMPTGLLCYSNPKLLLGNPHSKKLAEQASNYQLYRFVKEHYKAGWVFFLFFAQLNFERKFPVSPFIRSLFSLRKKINTGVLSKIETRSKSISRVIRNLDVIIPTIGRKKYLLDVLKDLASQTVLPKRVIIVEQNPDTNATTELDYLTSETWPFQIVHRFIHQTGACNARNIAIKELESEWVFMADDDIRIPENSVEKVFQFLETYKCKVVTLNCLREGDINTAQNIRQWNSFGSGCSVVASEIVKSTFFNMSYEHGFGEDTEYGMQLRNKGYDVLYQPKNVLQHLKAPIGGFRNPIKKAWETDEILPKPSPTIMLYRLNHTTPFQQRGYKLLLFIKFYKNQPVKNPFVYLKKMKKAWNGSISWANKLEQQ